MYGTVTTAQAPQITSADSATFTAATPETFTITTTGVPTATIGETGALPAGVTLTDNHDGTATLTSTPATPAGIYQFAIGASNGASPDATQSFTLTVTQAAPVIIWDNPSDIIYGKARSATQLDATANVAGTFSYTLADGTTPADGATLGAGQSQALSVIFTPTDTTDYSTATAQVQINVDPATLTVTADGKNKVYGAALPALTASYSGFVNSDDASILSGAPSLTTTAVTSSPAGKYPITAAAGTLSAANYTFAFQSGALAVTQATPVITWDNPSDITYGTALGATQLDATSERARHVQLHAGRRQHASRRSHAGGRAAPGIERHFHTDRHNRLCDRHDTGADQRRPRHADRDGR